MKRLALIPAMLLLGGALSGQHVLVRPVTGDPAMLEFDPGFIARNGIRAIIGQPMVKRENEPMREKREKHLYRFDAQGRTIYSNNSFGRPGSGRDTASITYTYDTRGRLLEELHNDLGGHFALVRELDDTGRVIRETYARVENLGTDRYTLVPGTRTEISDERFRYATINDTAWMKVFMNSAGLPYREQVWRSDRWGYLRTVDDRWLVTGRLGSITFRYDEKGRLAERTERPDLGTEATTTYTWRYDATGNVTLCELRRGDQLVQHQEYLYEEGSMLLKATISKQLDTGLIHIVRYTTERQ